MLYIVLFLFALAPVIDDDGKKEGRKGNEHYENGRHEQAVTAYQEGLMDYESQEPDGILAGLWNNLGAALHRLGNADDAAQAFRQSMSLSEDQHDFARAAYNAGNNAFSSAQNQMDAAQAPPTDQSQNADAGNPLEDALDFYKQSLLANPENEDARYNYEFVKRQLEQQQEQEAAATATKSE